MPYVRCNGADLYVEDRGSGRPIVFLPGVTTGMRFFQDQLVDLADEFRTVGLDYRGHGRSEKTDVGHTVPQYARDLRSVLEQYELTDVVLVGWSMGALVAWDYVDQFGTDGVAGQVVVDMAASAFAWDDYEYGNTDLDGLRATLELVQTDHDSLVEGLIEATFAEPATPDQHRVAFDETSRPPPPIKSAIIFDYTMRDYRAVLPTIDVPSLVLAGADETWRSVAAVEDVAARLPDAVFEVFEESGHVLPLEEPEKFTRVVDSFATSL